jgi:lysophospholipase L1-like esterase
LLGGTNDIGTGAAVADVLAALASMHDAIHAAGARLVAMTLPPFNTRLPAERRAAYNALNEGLRQRLANVSAAARQAPASGEAQANAGAHTEAVAASGAQRQVRPRGHRRRSALVDLEPLFPVEAVDPEVKKATWSDHLHLTPAGYGQMAEAVFSAMLGHHWRRAGSGADESSGSGDSRSDASSASSAG